MCGPLVMAVPQNGGGKFGLLIDMILYNFGRLVVYGLLGLIIGVLGTPDFLINYQGKISIFIGVLLLAYLFIPIKLKSRILSGPISDKVGNYFRKAFMSFSGLKTKFGILLLGSLNGLLPCGLVYFALITASTLFDPFKSGLFMVIFGLGTLPIMMAVPVFKKMINTKVRGKLRGLIPFGIGLVGLLLIVRGLELGIPYLSPALDKKHHIESKQCH
jgi:sulfite exporter TauE/SafE